MIMQHFNKTRNVKRNKHLSSTVYIPSSNNVKNDETVVIIDQNKGKGKGKNKKNINMDTNTTKQATELIDNVGVTSFEDIKRLKSEKGLLERNDSDVMILTEDNKQLLKG